jgi:hypothetical protein
LCTFALGNMQSTGHPKDTHIHPNRYVNMKMWLCQRSQAIHTDREVTANRSDLIIKNKTRKKMHTNRCGNTSRQKCHAKGTRNENKMQEIMYGNTTNVKHEIYDYTSNNWSHRLIILLKIGRPFSRLRSWKSSLFFDLYSPIKTINPMTL